MNELNVFFVITKTSNLLNCWAKRFLDYKIQLLTAKERKVIHPVT